MSTEEKRNSLMIGGPLDGRVLAISLDHSAVNVPVRLFRGRGRVWTEAEYEAEVVWTYPPTPEPCPTCGHCDDDYDPPIRHEPADLEPFYATGKYRASNGWVYESPDVLDAPVGGGR